MASEIRVDKINSLSGVGTVTLSPTGVDISGITTVQTLKVGTGVTASEDGDIFFTGVCTATTFTGSGANLTNLPAANVTGTLPAISGANLTSLTAGNLTGALPAISGANLTGIAATDNVRTGILEVAGIATFSSDVKIGAAVTISESGIEASGIGITCANINGTHIGGRRNIIINGAMQVAQRSTSSTASDNSYASLDRFRATFSGTDETPTQAQVDVSSGTSPYTEGFRKAFKITNGNQTSGAGADDYVRIGYGIEAQDMANSGWNYTSSSSFITFQFWVKSSVAQSFKVELYVDDGTAQAFSFDTGSLTADTWTKIIKTIPGNSNLTFSNDNGEGLYIRFLPFFGTSFTNNSVTEDTWAAYSGSARTKDNTTTWYTTNDATFELTGVQLEVGTQATAFEHRSLGDELKLCERYYEICATGQVFTVESTHSGYIEIPVIFRTEKRTTPTITLLSSTENFVSSVTAVGGNSTEKIYQAGLRGNTIVASGNSKYLYGKVSSEAEM